MRDRERDFGQRSEGATIGGGGCDEPALPIWACFRERPPLGKRVFFYLYFFFNKLCLVARKGRKVNNGVTILLIDLLGQNLIMFSLFFGF